MLNNNASRDVTEKCDDERQLNKKNNEIKELEETTEKLKFTE